MLRPYRQLFTTSGTFAFSLTGMIARLPISMLGLGIVLLVRQATGRYALAGTVVAVFTLVQAAAMPVLGRWVDRYGQHRVLLPAQLVHSLGVLALVACAVAHAPTLAFCLAAAVAGGAMLSVGALVRARWSNAIGGTSALHTAYSLEAVLDELVFVVGPVTVTTLAAAVSPTFALLTATAIGLTGVLVFTSLRRTEPEPSGEARRGGSALRIGGLRTLLAVFTCLGAVFGGLDVVVVAVAESDGHRGAAGPILATFAFGSGLSGLVYGSRHFRRRAEVRMATGSVVFAASCLPLGFLPSLPALAVAAFVTGLAISPTLIPGNQVIEALMPPERLTEGLTWSITALNLGVAAGAPVAGAIVDAHGARWGFAAMVVGSALAATIGTAFVRTMRAPVRREPLPAAL